MAWLVREGEVLAALEVAESFADRSRGLLGRDQIEGALLLRPCRSVHTLGMRFPIDVAFLRSAGDSAWRVHSAQTMRRWRVGRPHLGCSCAIEAQSGAFERWRLRPGDVVEIKE